MTHTYDALNRVTYKDLPGGEPDVTFTYDLLGRVTGASQSGNALTYDALGRNLTQVGPQGTITSAYDFAGRRTRLTHPDGFYVDQDYIVTGEMAHIRENGASSGAGVLATYAYDDLGRTTSLTRGDGSVLGFTYDSVSRPTQIADDLGGTSYTYTSENLLTAASGGITLAYDPAMRLYQTAGGTPGTTRFAYDGNDLIAEYSSSNALLRRYVHGPATDEPLVWYEGSGTSDRRFLHSDELGSVIAIGSGAGTSVNTYDEYGIPRSTNTGRFQYTGQTWVPEIGMYNYKARFYSPTLGRFLQADPVGYADAMNVYGYAHADPVGLTDPSGTSVDTGEDGDPCPGHDRCWDVRATNHKYDPILVYTDASGQQHALYASDPNPSQEALDALALMYGYTIVVTARRDNLGNPLDINWLLRFPMEQIWVYSRSQGLIRVPTKVLKVVKNPDGSETTYVGPAPGFNVPNDLIWEIHTHTIGASVFPEIGDYGHGYPVFGIHLDSGQRWVVMPNMKAFANPMPLPNFGKGRFPW